MVEPSIQTLVTKADSRYTLVIEAAKRARQLAAGARPTLECGSNKYVTIALHEIKEGKVTFLRTKDGIK